MTGGFARALAAVGRPRGRSPLLIVAMAFASSGLLVAAEARATPPRSIGHRVRRGESAESLALLFYGDRSLARFIGEANRLGHGAPAPGSLVRIPTAIVVHAARGDSLDRIARRLLGDRRRGPFLGEWNGLREGQALAVGQALTIPFHLVHRVRAPESLASIALAFYGDASQGRLLAAYNFRSSTVLARGERIVIPVPHVKLLPSRREEAARADAPSGPRWPSPGVPAGESEARAAISAATPTPEAPVPPDAGAPGISPSLPRSPARIIEGMREAERAWREGSYEEAQGLLQRLVSDDTATTTDRASIHRLLGFVDVALGAEEDALREFRAVIDADPAATLDETSVSPKIRAAFERARARR